MNQQGRRTIEVFEVQRRSSLLSSWQAANFTTKDGLIAENKDRVVVQPGYFFDGSWKLDLSNVEGAAGVGETDEDGWDYANDTSRYRFCSNNFFFPQDGI